MFCLYLFNFIFFFSIGIFLFFFFYRISLFSIHLGHICGYIFFSNRCRSRKILWKQSSFYNCTKYRFHTVHVYRFPDENGSTSLERFVQRTLFLQHWFLIQLILLENQIFYFSIVYIEFKEFYFILRYMNGV